MPVLRLMTHACLAILTLTLMPTIVAAQETYTIRYNRPVKVGDRFRQVSQASESQNLSLSTGGNVLQQRNEEIEVSFESRGRVDAVNEKGLPTKVSHVIDKLEKRTGDRQAVLLAPGDVVVATSDGDEVTYVVNDQAVSDDLKKVLAMTIVVSTRQPTEDDLFGTDQPRRAGETWAMSTDLVAATMQRMNVQVDPQNVSGEGKLVEITSEGNETLMRQTGAMTVKNLKPAGLPEALAMNASEATMKYTNVAPVDPTQPMREETKAYDLTFSASGQLSPQSGPVAYEVTVSRKTHTTYEWEQ